MNVLVAQNQHIRLDALASRQPNRPVLVQPRIAVSANQKAVAWLPATQVRRTQEIWTHSVLLNEVLFDVDVPTWQRMAEATAQLVAPMRELGIPHEECLSGGKGAHISVFLDPASITGDAALLQRANEAGVDLWSTTRLAIAEALLDAADFPVGDEARWGGTVGDGPFDRLKVKWSASRAGSMVRMLGTPGNAGFRKTLVPPAYDWLASKPEDSRFMRWAPLPPMWSIPPALSSRVMDALEAACERAEAKAATAPQEATLNPLEALATLRRVPCAAYPLANAVPRGARHYAFLNLVVSAYKLGVPRQACENLLTRALERTGLPSDDPAMEIVEEVYDGRYDVSRLSCPSPHVTKWCEGKQNECALSRKLTFGCRAS